MMVEVLLRHCSCGKKYKRIPESIRSQNKWAVAKLLVWSSVVLVLVAVWPYSISNWQTICMLAFLSIYLISEIIGYINRKKYTSNLELYFSSDFIFLMHISIEISLILKIFLSKKLTVKIYL